MAKEFFFLTKESSESGCNKMEYFDPDKGSWTSLPSAGQKY